MTSPIHYERLIIGYHGCDRSVGEQVLLSGEGLKPSNNAYDWLGEGIYFWEHGPSRALEWAKWMRSRGKIKNPWVLGAFIHLGRCLDLTDTAATALLPGWYEGLKLWLEPNEQVPENRAVHDEDHDLLLRYRDCAVLNFGLQTMERMGAGYQTVRGVFVEGEAAFEGSKIMAKTHVQIAVRDSACILGYFSPAR